jgi:threonine synthase
MKLIPRIRRMLAIRTKLPGSCTDYGKIVVSFVKNLRCSKCGHNYNLSDNVCLCRNWDDGRLDIDYDYSEIADRLSKNALMNRETGVWKYRELLPVTEEKAIVSFGEGGTPLIRSTRLAERLHARNLFLKDETRNPTASYKDRSISVGISKAVEAGAKTVVTCSSGNAAASLAAYSARAGLECYAFVLDIAPEQKLVQIRTYGGKVVRVRGVEKGADPTVTLLKETVKRYGWYPCPGMGPFNPYQVEGSKTIAFEIVEQMKWKVPDWVVLPMGCGCLLTGVWKGFRDLRELGLVDGYPKIAGVQSTGNAPIVRAFRDGRNPSQIEAWEKPNTIAGGIADPYPWDGDGALTAIRTTKGVATAVPDEDILEAELHMASTEGIFAEPTGVTSLAGYIDLVETGTISRDDNVVVLLTGNGLKDVSATARLFGKTPTISPTIGELENAVGINTN